MRLALTALVALATAGAAAQDGVSQDGASVTEGDAPEEAESSTAAPIGPALLYTRELTNQDLAQKVRDDLTSLGSISIGFADRGLIINAVQMPQDPAWIIERPDFSYAVRETVDALAQAFRSVRRQFPDSAPARLNHISAKDGGYLRPHRSHQSGRDADIGLFYKGDRFPPRGALRERLIDSARRGIRMRSGSEDRAVRPDSSSAGTRRGDVVCLRWVTFSLNATTWRSILSSARSRADYPPALRRARLPWAARQSR